VRSEEIEKRRGFGHGEQEHGRRRGEGVAEAGCGAARAWLGRTPVSGSSGGSEQGRGERERLRRRARWQGGQSKELGLAL
jgi:hypothetical protein